MKQSTETIGTVGLISINVVQNVKDVKYKKLAPRLRGKDIKN